MTPERWQKIKELFDAASKRETHDRSAFLRAACGGDEDLQREVQLLLEQDSGTGILALNVIRAVASDVIEQLNRDLCISLSANSCGAIIAARKLR